MVKKQCRQYLYKCMLMSCHHNKRMKFLYIWMQLTKSLTQQWHFKHFWAQYKTFGLEADMEFSSGVTMASQEELGAMELVSNYSPQIKNKLIFLMLLDHASQYKLVSITNLIHNFQLCIKLVIDTSLNSFLFHKFML